MTIMDALKRVFTQKVTCNHNWHTDIRLCVGSTLSWAGVAGDAVNSIARSYECHQICSICSATQVDRLYRPRQWDETRGYKWNDNDYPLDDHGNKLPVAPDYGVRKCDYFGGEKLTFFSESFVMATAEHIPQGQEREWLDKSVGLEMKAQPS